MTVPTPLIVGELEGGDHLFEDAGAFRQATAHTVARGQRYLGERRRAGRSAAA